METNNCCVYDYLKINGKMNYMDCSFKNSKLKNN